MKLIVCRSSFDAWDLGLGHFITLRYWWRFLLRRRCADDSWEKPGQLELLVFAGDLEAQLSEYDEGAST